MHHDIDSNYWSMKIEIIAERLVEDCFIGENTGSMKIKVIVQRLVDEDEYNINVDGVMTDEIVVEGCPMDKKFGAMKIEIADIRSMENWVKDKNKNDSLDQMEILATTLLDSSEKYYELIEIFTIIRSADITKQRSKRKILRNKAKLCTHEYEPTRTLYDLIQDIINSELTIWRIRQTEDAKTLARISLVK